jgi:Holliday junction resolvase
MPINSRSKGQRGEKMVVKLFDEWTGMKFSRTPASGGLRWKKDNTAGDIVLTEEGIYFPFCIEIKFHKDINFSHLIYQYETSEIAKFWEQATRDAERCNKVPILFMRYDRMPKGLFFVVIYYKHYLLFKKYLDPEPNKLRFNRELMILNSKALLNSDFTCINRIALQILNRDENGRKK